MKYYVIDLLLIDACTGHIVDSICNQFVVRSDQFNFFIPFVLSLSDSSFSVQILVKYRTSLYKLYNGFDKKTLISVVSQLKSKFINVY